MLSESELSLLENCEQTIRKGLESESGAQFNIGNALKTIRDKKLYRKTHKTLEAWAEQVFNIQRARVYQYIDHAEIISGMSTSGRQNSNVIHLPVNERQTRELKKVEPEKRQEVFEKAFEKHQGQPTAKEIAQIAEENNVIQKGLKKLDFGKDLEALYSMFRKLKAKCRDESDREALETQCRGMLEEAEEFHAEHKATLTKAA